MQEEFFSLSNQIEQNIQLSQNQNYIVLKKIVITTFLGMSVNDWYSRLTRIQPQLRFRCETGASGYYESTLDIAGLISLSNNQPVIEFPQGYVIPERFTLSPSGHTSIPHYSRIVVELIYGPNSTERSNTEMSIFYYKY